MHDINGAAGRGSSPGRVLLGAAAVIGALLPLQVQAQGPDSGTGLLLDTISVQGAAESATGPVDGVAASASATGTKTDTPLVETPQTVHVVPAWQVAETGARSLPDALAYTPGVSQTYGWTLRTGDQVQMRGFEIWNTLRDGMTYQVNTYDGQQEPYGLERIEVLKGATSVLYGNLRPGGVVNAVSKRPTDAPFGEVGLEIGSHARRQVSADTGGPIDPEGVWSWRLSGLVRDSDTFIDHVPDDRRFLSGALRWRPDARTSVTLLSEYQQDHTAAFSAVLPAAGVVLPNGNGTIARSRFVGEPGHDRYRLDRWSAGYQLDHAFSDAVRLHQGLRYYAADQDNRFLSYDLLAADQRTVTRSGQDRNEQTWGLTTDTALEIGWADGRATHTSLVGIDASRLRLTSKRYSRTATDLDLFDPAYGGPVGPRVPAYAWGDTVEQIGLYAQDQMKIGDRWVVVFGGRQDWVRQTSTDPFTGAVTADGERSDAFTARAGLVYLAPNGLAPYASFSQSFEPVTGFDRQGTRFVPTRGTQYELGLRYVPPGRDILLAAAVYELTQTNGLVSDPADTTFSVQLGEERSRGLELEARAALTETASVIAAYAYTDAETVDGGPLAPGLAGRQKGGIPRHMAALWADWRLAALGLPGLKIGAGIRHVGEMPANWAEFTVPGYTVVDAMASYETGAWKLQANAVNLFDKAYASCTADCFWGEPRRLALTLTRRW